MAGFFLYNKNQRNFPQDWEKLLTRFAASCNKISGIPVSCVFLCSFLWTYSSSGGKYAPPEELLQKSFRSFSLSANSLFMGFPAEGLAFKILQRDQWPEGEKHAGYIGKTPKMPESTQP